MNLIIYIYSINRPLSQFPQLNRSLMSDAEGDLTSGQEGGGTNDEDEDDVNVAAGRVRRPEELESLQSGVSSDVEEGVNVEKKIKRFGKHNKRLI